jgi:hypothetical protein
MPIAYARARSLDVDPSNPTTTPCRKAGSQGMRVCSTARRSAADAGSAAMRLRLRSAGSENS